MKETKTMTLDKKDKELVQIFAELGMPHNLAKIFVFISQVEEWKAIDIEKILSLRQPNVSIVMQKFEKKGWIKKRNKKKNKGKGRPIHIYSLKKSVSEIIKNFEEEKLKEIEIMKKNLNQLHEHLDSINQ